jgi:quercetin dioxygenase-like cupin family protein
MKLLSSALLSISLLDATFPLVSHGQTAPADATPNSPSITIVHSGSQAPQKGPTDRFTGSVRVQPLFGARAPSHTSGGLVTFEPGARSAWHSHPVGQVLIVTAGTGWIQTWGGPIQEFHQGDIVLIPPGVKRWHGASPTSSMTHIAIKLRFHLKRARENGVTEAELIETITHLAFYCGWPRPCPLSRSQKKPSNLSRNLKPFQRRS